MGLGAILCPDRIGQPAPPSFHPQNRLTGLMVIAHFNLHAEHNWFPTRKRFAAPKASELATVLPIGNRRYSRFGNLRYVQRALNRYQAGSLPHFGSADLTKSCPTALLQFHPGMV